MNPIEASLVLAVAFVVANDGGQIAGPKSIMSHDAAPYSEVPGPLHSAGREIKSYPSKLLDTCHSSSALAVLHIRQPSPVLVHRVFSAFLFSAPKSRRTEQKCTEKFAGLLYQ